VTIARLSQVGDGGSELLMTLFGSEMGHHARTAIGVASLTKGVAVEVRNARD
jgi:hypothetical protein